VLKFISYLLQDPEKHVFHIVTDDGEPTKVLFIIVGCVGDGNGIYRL
jgi:hypothetical protein